MRRPPIALISAVAGLGLVGAPVALSCQPVSAHDRTTLLAWQQSLQRFNHALVTFSLSVSDGSDPAPARTPRARRALATLTSAAEAVQFAAAALEDDGIARLVTPVGRDVGRLAVGERALYRAALSRSAPGRATARTSISRAGQALARDGGAAIDGLQARYCDR